MYRISSGLRINIVQRSRGKRLQSTYPGYKFSAKFTAALIVGSGSVTAGVVSYAAMSKSKRKSVEGSIPGSSYVLNAFLGPSVELPPPKLVPPQSPATPLAKKLEREKKRIEEEKVVAKENTIVANKTESSKPVVKNAGKVEDGKTPVVVGPGSNVTSQIQETKKSESDICPVPSQSTKESDIETRLRSQELSEAVENTALSHQLQELSLAAQKAVGAARLAGEESAQHLKERSRKVLQLLESGGGEELIEAAVAGLERTKTELNREVEKKMVMAKDAVEKLNQQVTSAKASVLTRANTSLITAEEMLSEMKYVLEKSQTALTEAVSDASVVRKFRDMIQSGAEQFQAEVRSILPDVKIGETSEKLTPEELNLLIAHAHRKVLQLQKQLAQQQTLEHERFRQELSNQHQHDSSLLDAKIKTELEKQRKNLEAEFHRKGTVLREEMETELRTQLKRQAAAHSDHLADVLTIQEEDLETKWLTRLADEIHAERKSYYENMAGMLGQLHGLKTAVVTRADLDKAAHSAREFWLACESLRAILRLGNDSGKSWQDQLKPVKPQVEAIQFTAGCNDSFVLTLLQAVPQVAMDRGVYTGQALKERFMKVDRICKRVSMVGDNGGSLIRYFISYLRSFLIVASFEYLPENEAKDEVVPMDELSVHDILDRARYCLDKDDLMQAVRYMNLLKGEPRQVASDWLKEARLHLELAQLAEALQVHAAATTVRAL